MNFRRRRTVERGSRTVVIPFGSVEYQGGHLPLGSDALLADVVGETVAGRLDAVLAPTIRVGYAEQHMSSVGTLSVPADIVRETAFHVADSLIGHGFRVIALIQRTARTVLLSRHRYANCTSVTPMLLHARPAVMLAKIQASIPATGSRP